MTSAIRTRRCRRLRLALVLGTAPLPTIWTVAVAAQTTGDAQANATDPATTPEVPADGDAADIVVTGIRGSLASALAVKRNSVAIVDAIASEDIGKLPDQNVAESLQRIPGISIQRSNGDGQKLTVRGLAPIFNAVTVNGRLLATDDPGREFNFDVLPSELITGASVYKSPLASLAGSSIGATVDVKTARPLELKNHVLVLSAQANYNELSDKVNPTMSGLASFKNNSGNFGVAVALSYQKRNRRVDQQRDSGDYTGRGNALSTDYYYGRTAPGVPLFTNSIAHLSLGSDVIIDNDERIGANATVQYRPTANSLLTIDALYSRYHDKQITTGYNFDFDRGTLTAAEISGGQLQTQVINGVPQQVIVGGDIVYQSVEGGNLDEAVIYNNRKVDTLLLGANYKIEAGQWTITADGAYSSAKRSGRDDPSSGTATVRRKGLNTSIDGRGDGPLVGTSAIYPSGNLNLTSSDGLFAHIELPGGTGVRDRVVQGGLNGKWASSASAVLNLGASYQRREKRVRAYGRDFVDLCQFCNSDYQLPSNLFTPGNYNIFAGENGNQITDLVNYDPSAIFDNLRNNFDKANGGGFLPIQPLFREPKLLQAQSPTVAERVLAAYAMFDLDLNLGSMPLHANFGLRYEQTNFDSTGFGQELLSAVQRDRGDGVIKNVVELSAPQALQRSGSYHDFLPSINLKLDMTDKLVARAAFSRVVTRPPLGVLAFNQTVSENTTGLPRITRGNPDLQPYRATQVEFGLEWYFTRLGLLSAAVFQKDLDSFIANATTTQRVDQVDFFVTQPQNGDGATIKGVELTYQQSLNFGLGWALNYTHVNSSATLTDQSGGSRTFTQEGLSPNSFNATVYFVKGGFEARAAYNYRDSYIVNAFGNGGRPNIFDSYGQLDASLQYRIGDRWTLSAQALNLTDEREFVYNVDQRYLVRYGLTGRRYLAGVRVNF